MEKAQGSDGGMEKTKSRLRRNQYSNSPIFHYSFISYSLQVGKQSTMQ